MSSALDFLLAVIAKSECLHGGPPDDPKKDECIKAIAVCFPDIGDFQPDEEETVEDYVTDFSWLMKDTRWVDMFWELPEYSHLAGPELLGICFNLATNFLLDKKFTLARRFVNMAIRLEALLDKIELDRMPDGESKALALRDATTKLLNYMDKFETNRNMVRLVSSKAGCLCLNSLKAEAKKVDKMVNCACCNEYYFANQIMLCSQCKVTRYCSKKCQRKHWREGHKQECSRWKNIGAV